MLLNAMCPHMVLLTQFYPHCAFQTPNLENHLHLSIVMLLRAMCSHTVLLTQFYPQCQLKPRIWKSTSI